MSEGLILEALADAGLALASPLIRDNADAERFFAVIEVSRDSENKQVPTNRKLHAIRDRLHEAGVRLEFLLRDATANDIEGGLRATILHGFIDEVRNVFMSIDAGEAHVWVEPKTQLPDELTLQLRERASHFLSDVGLRLGTLRSTVNQNLPSKLALLASLRIVAPSTLGDLAAALTQHQFEVPSNEWLNRRLDALRKEGAVIRTDDGLYALTLRSLTNLGTKKNARSPDIARLLKMAALGK